jgi:hypothetical protein
MKQPPAATRRDAPRRAKLEGLDEPVEVVTITWHDQASAYV